jgi:type IV pilus assembly protein PilM
VGLDVDSGYVSVALPNGRAITTPLGDGLVADGEVVDSAELANELKSLFRRESLPKRVWLGVANNQIVVRQLELPPIADAEQLAAAVRFQAEEELPMPLAEVVLDHQVVGSRAGADSTERIQVVVVAARRTMVERFVEALRGAGLKPLGVDLSAFALVRALAAPEVSDQSASVYCHLAGVTTLAVAVGRTCHFARPLSGDARPDGAAAIAEEVRLATDFYMTQPDARPVGNVVLSGPGALREGLADEVGEHLDVPVTIAALAGAAGASPEDAHRQVLASGLAKGESA